MKNKISCIKGLPKAERLQERRQDAEVENSRKRIVEYDSSIESTPPSSEEDDSTLGIPSSASIEEFAQGFKDTAIEVDRISLYCSESEEDQ